MVNKETTFIQIKNLYSIPKKYAICVQLSAWINALIVLLQTKVVSHMRKIFLFDDWRKANVCEDCYTTPRPFKYTIYDLLFSGVDQEEEKVGGNLTSETHIIIIMFERLLIDGMKAVFVLLPSRYKIWLPILLKLCQYRGINN